MAELLARVSSRELSEWMAYEQVTGPLGGRRADHHSALITWAIVNTQRGKHAPIPLERFLPSWDSEASRSTPEALWAKAQQLNAAFGGTVSGG